MCPGMCTGEFASSVYTPVHLTDLPYQQYVTPLQQTIKNCTVQCSSMQFKAGCGIMMSHAHLLLVNYAAHDCYLHCRLSSFVSYGCGSTVGVVAIYVCINYACGRFRVRGDISLVRFFAFQLILPSQNICAACSACHESRMVCKRRTLAQNLWTCDYRGTLHKLKPHYGAQQSE